MGVDRVPLWKPPLAMLHKTDEAVNIDLQKLINYQGVLPCWDQTNYRPAYYLTKHMHTRMLI